jgi:hypothetical protein
LPRTRASERVGAAGSDGAVGGVRQRGEHASVAAAASELARARGQGRTRQLSIWTVRPQTIVVYPSARASYLWL